MQILRHSAFLERTIHFHTHFRIKSKRRFHPFNSLTLDFFNDYFTFRDYNIKIKQQDLDLH